MVETCRKTHRNAGANMVPLSHRELQLAQLVTEGQQNKEIGFQLGITEGTVKVYMSHLFAKLGVSNRAELSAWAARRNGDLQPAPPRTSANTPPTQWFTPDLEAAQANRGGKLVRSQTLTLEEFSRLAHQLTADQENNKQRFTVLVWTAE
jgi:DNA-binding CsgD family transcriptional regulator